jgi:hypothetical protein
MTAHPPPPNADREAVWVRITARNPGLLQGRAMTPAGLRKFFDYAWDAGVRSAATHSGPRAPDFIRDLFGR